jgi:hypothetical protein
MHPKEDAACKFLSGYYRSAVIRRKSARHKAKKGGVFDSEAAGQVGLESDYEGQSADWNAIECVNQIKMFGRQGIK